MHKIVQFIVTSIVGFSFSAQATPPLSTTPFEVEQKQLIESEKNSIKVFKEASPMVVSVDSTQRVHDFFSMSSHEVPAGSGSGFVWDNQGHVVTNFHVIRNAQRRSTKISVTTKDGQELSAEIVGVEPKKDIAVLRVPKLAQKFNGFSTKVSNSKQLQVGQKVLAIGNPFGFEHTLTQGVVSATNRSMPSVLHDIKIRNMIQTDASINPGNSGGPLIDSSGRLIGMNTAIISGSGSSSGVGFAVPSNTIKRVVKQIIQYGEVVQPGIGIEPLDSFQMQMLSRYGHNVKKGVVIKAVVPGSPAEKMGLKGLEIDRRHGVKLGDVITHVDQKPVDTFDDLYYELSEKTIGEKVELSFIRNQKTKTKVIQLAALNKLAIQR